MSWIGGIITDYLKKKYDRLDFAWILSKAIHDRIQQQINFSDKIVIFDDRFNSASKLVVLLAGKKKYLWDLVFKRLNEFLEYNAHVVVVNPGGLNSEDLRRISKNYGWSYLETKSRRLATGINMAIDYYKDSIEWIYKMDDDVFITQRIFEKLLKAYQMAKESSPYYPAVALPVFNVNEATYLYFIRTLGIEQEFKKRFNAELKFGNHLVWKNPEVAVWLWEHSLPIDHVADIFNRNAPFDICNMRISIGLMLIHLETWLNMQGFESCTSGSIGSDEEGLANYISNNMLGWVIATNAFAGHFSYYSQEDTMKKFFEKRKKEFDISS